MASTNTSIEWTDRCWNPLRGCTRVSQGCTNCYAEKIAYRFSGPGQAFEGLSKKVGNEARWTGKIMLVEKELETPLKWKKPARIFVNSVSDLFHEAVPFEYIDRVFATMTHPEGRKHTYQILTKRPERMLEYFRYVANNLADFNDGNGPDYDWLMRQPHIWLGTSVEDQKTADERIPLLLQIRVAIRFLSCEPLLGPINILEPGDPEQEGWWDYRYQHDYYKIAYPGVQPPISWVIAGGESGTGARPAHPDWFRSLRDQCQYAKVPFFFKQWGNWVDWSKTFNQDYGKQKAYVEKQSGKFHILPTDWPGGVDYRQMVNVGKHAAGRELDGRTWDEMPGVEALAV